MISGNPGLPSPEPANSTPATNWMPVLTWMGPNHKEMNRHRVNILFSKLGSAIVWRVRRVIYYSTRIWTAPGLMWKHWQVSGNSWTLHTWLSMTFISKQFWISSLLKQCHWPSRAKHLCGPQVANHTLSFANNPLAEICLGNTSKRQSFCLGTD